MRSTSQQQCVLRTVTLNNIFDAGDLLQRVDILCVVAEEFVVTFNSFNKPVTQRGRELSWIYFAGKLKERSRIFPEEVYVKHGLGVGQVWKIDSESGIDTVPTSEVGDTARHRHLQDKEQSRKLRR